MTEAIAPALSTEALWGKSKKYISRALLAKARGDLGEYQLWASLSLELLGKSALAKIHPCLVADPQSYISMFAAAGKNVGTDIKTIIAKTLFERLTHVSIRFDKKTQEFCTNMSLKRNAELHSGEAPFEATEASSWEGRYWHTIDIILQSMDSAIETWLGADNSRAPKELLEEYTHALVEAAKIRVETAAEAFKELSKKERDEAHARAKRMSQWDVRAAFRDRWATIWDETCPACKSRAFIAGITIYEEIADEDDPDTGEETVDVTLGAEEFHCPSCELHLNSRDEIEAAELDVERTVTEMRQREYEPDYGND
ncbi:MAG: hypothetical protein Q8S20_06185 [Sulfuritalea sp.]|nr:hypothetical protein [Sulfuritalea sp.]